jgi:hypothetical protein
MYLQVLLDTEGIDAYDQVSSAVAIPVMDLFNEA